MTFTNRIARVSVSVDWIGKASTHLEKMSVKTSIYLLPLEVSSRGPIMSQESISKR